MADELNEMEERTKQGHYRQEDEMARGLVSRGASNKEAPMYQSSTSSQEETRLHSHDYAKLIKQRRRHASWHGDVH